MQACNQCRNPLTHSHAFGVQLTQPNNNQDGAQGEGQERQERSLDRLQRSVHFQQAPSPPSPPQASNTPNHLSEAYSKAAYTDLQPSQTIGPQGLGVSKLQEAPRQVCPQMVQVGVHGVGPPSEVQVVREIEAILIQIIHSNLDATAVALTSQCRCADTTR